MLCRRKLAKHGAKTQFFGIQAHHELVGAIRQVFYESLGTVVTEDEERPGLDHHVVRFPVLEVLHDVFRERVHALQHFAFLEIQGVGEESVLFHALFQVFTGFTVGSHNVVVPAIQLFQHLDDFLPAAHWQHAVCQVDEVIKVRICVFLVLQGILHLQNGAPRKGQVAMERCRLHGAHVTFRHRGIGDEDIVPEFFIVEHHEDVVTAFQDLVYVFGDFFIIFSEIMHQICDFHVKSPPDDFIRKGIQIHCQLCFSSFCGGPVQS